MFTPHKTPWKTTLYQSWIKTFNPNCLAGMKLLMWIFLCMLPLMYKPLCIMLATQVGTMLGFDISNKWRWNQHFYIVMDMDQRWVEYVEIPRFDGLNVEVNVHYEQFLILLLSLCNHEILGPWMSSPRRLTINTIANDQHWWHEHCGETRLNTSSSKPWTKQSRKDMPTPRTMCT